MIVPAGAVPLIRQLFKARSGKPAFNWVWSQQWQDVLFLHWRISECSLRPHVPQELEIDTYEGNAWVSVVLFRLKVRPRGLPFLPFVSELVEVNLRTYVSYRGKPGVIFLNVHADNRMAVAVAKLFTPVPYRRTMIDYRFATNRGAFSSRVMESTFQMRSGAVEEAKRDSLDEFLLERYRLYAIGRDGELLHAEVKHPRWRTERVDAQIESNHLGDEFGLKLSMVPEHAHFSAGVPALFGRFKPAV